jgi:nicotinamidase/pyrazinamidase
MDKRAALLIVDLQNDFCPSGALAVPDGERVVVPLNRAAQLFAAEGLPVLVSRDWHPPQTCHFREFGGLWPPHCVQGSPGAEFHPGLHLPPGTLVISKGCDPDSDSYSAFDGKADDGRTLQEVLEGLGIGQLFVGGLASDYCVRSTVLDARKAGFEVTVLSDGIAGVEVVPGDTYKALEEMQQSGARFCRVDEL